MQLLTDASTARLAPGACAKQMMETVPLVMQFIRRQMRAMRANELSVPQLRTMYFININEQPTLSDAADFIGLSLPAMSRLVDALVKKKLVARADCPDDRRRLRLTLTDAGTTALDSSWKGTHARLTDEVARMSPEQRKTVSAAMDVLRAAFDPDVV